MAYDKEGRRAERFLVRSILNVSWDPIGVADEEIVDEYGGYAGDLHAMLRKGASRDEVVRYLLRAEGERMGLTPGPARAGRVADELLRLELRAA